MKKTYTAYLQPFEDGYLVKIPDLPSCVTSGKTLQEASEMAIDALSACLLVIEDEGLPLPEPTSPDSLDPPTNAHLLLVPVDTVAYRMSTDTAAVRRNVSLPAWMDGMAKKRGINCSQVLQDSLRELLDVPS